MGKGISRAIHRKDKMLYRFYCRTALTRLLCSRLLAVADLRSDAADVWSFGVKRTAETRFRMAFSLMPSSFPIILLSSPAATRSKTWSSRGVSALRPAPAGIVRVEGDVGRKLSSSAVNWPRAGATYTSSSGKASLSRLQVFSGPFSAGA